MSVEKVREYFSRLNMEGRVRELDGSCATVALAAAALGVDGARIAKTMAFMVGGDAVLVLTAGDMKIDNAKFKAAFGCKARMLTAEELSSRVGHLPGGVCPFAIPEGVKVYLDESLKRFGTVFPAAGSGNSCVELSIEELERFGNSTGWVDVSKKGHAD